MEGRKEEYMRAWWGAEGMSDDTEGGWAPYKRKRAGRKPRAANYTVPERFTVTGGPRAPTFILADL